MQDRCYYTIICSPKYGDPNTWANLTISASMCAAYVRSLKQTRRYRCKSSQNAVWATVLTRTPKTMRLEKPLHRRQTHTLRVALDTSFTGVNPTGVGLYSRRL